ncbi:peptidylprolyl isomerase [Dokdonella sp.]|uniref:peptidylprolyl isomerase n=1 Tax=Dokdonella sp. TaxID=2291710 RepID=UPI0025C3A7A5|nr:peptidylprolyl isomerase [Dokdonella sp.]MBX3693459.1 peptidyl-prolyl cis-trans isomerase [Dokdonella sp.]MCW5569457.1 peptidyl-prolyl cis-trans isomerase [Dokdonella sp.]
MTEFPRFIRGVAAAASAVLVLAACGGQGGATTKWPADLAMVETINGEPVPQLMLELLARDRRLDLSVPEQRERAMLELRQYFVLDQAARKQGFVRDPGFLAGVELYRLQGSAEATLARFREAATVDEAALKAEYDRQVAAAGPDEYDFSQLLFDDENDALNAVADVATKPFEAVFEAWRAKAKQARAFSGVRPAQLPEPLGKALAELKAGETTRLPIKADFGFAVLHVSTIRPVTPPPFEQVREGVRASVLARYADQRLEELMSAAKVETKTPTPAKP